MNTRLKNIRIFLMLSLFVGFVPMLLFVYWGIYPLNIYWNADEYSVGVFCLEDLDCGNGHGSDDFNCYGYGKINDKKAKVNLGLKPGIKTINKSRYADLSSDSIPVFYRPNMWQTIVIKNNEMTLDKNKYLVKGIIHFIYPLIIYPLLYFFYKRVDRLIENKLNKEVKL